MQRLEEMLKNLMSKLDNDQALSKLTIRVDKMENLINKLLKQIEDIRNIKTATTTVQSA